MYLIVLALSLHLLPLHLPKHSERVILIIRQTHFSHLNVGEGNGGGVCGGGGLGVVIHVCLHVFYLDPEIRGEAGPPGPSPESATVSFLTLA